MKLITSLTLAAFLAVCGAQTPDYCDKSLCPKNKTHVACNGLKTLSPECGTNATEVSLSSSQKDLILDLHNKVRNTVALGKQANGAGKLFKQASKMATLQWDQELADIAAVNARSCVFAHDQCRNTPTMRFVGQNLGITDYKGITQTSEQVIDRLVNKWYDESKGTTTSQLASCPSNDVCPVIGHYTQMVSDRSSKMGCSLVRYTKDKTYQLLVCNYGVTNMMNQPIYVAGKAASGCKTRNPKYPGLCGTSDTFTNNP